MNYLSYSVLIVIYLLIVTEKIQIETIFEIEDLNFVINEMAVDNYRWRVTGIVVNNSDTTISPPWYIEAMFYSDSTFTNTFGGNNTLINYPLDPGITTHWSLTHSVESVLESDYKSFAVKNLRGYIKK